MYGRYEPIAISFSEDFVQHLGRMMPCGLSVELPARLKVRYNPRAVRPWQVYCGYITLPHIQRIVYSTQDRPEWLDGSKTSKNARAKRAGKCGENRKILREQGKKSVDSD